MKHFRKILAVLLLGGSSLAVAAPCMSGTLADYVTLGASGCSLLAGQARDFVAPLSGQTGFNAIDPSSIFVTPITNPLLPGFTFTLKKTTADRLESFFRFSLQGLSSTGQTLTMAGAAATGDGSVSVVEDLCGGGSFNPTQPINCSGMTLGPLITLVTATDQFLTDAASFKAANFFNIFVDITLDGPGPTTGTATLGSVSLQFAAASSAVPEPATLALLLVALLTLAGITRRQHRNR